MLPQRRPKYQSGNDLRECVGHTGGGSLRETPGRGQWADAERETRGRDLVSYSEEDPGHFSSKGSRDCLDQKPLKNTLKVCLSKNFRQINQDGVYVCIHCSWIATICTLLFFGKYNIHLFIHFLM